MRWREGQYLLFENSVAKINKIDRKWRLIKWQRCCDKKTKCAKLRKWSKGNTIKGYDWQQIVSIKHLDKLHKENKVRIISPNEVMEILFANFERCMPIKNVEDC